MVESINSWFQNGCDYAHGVSLYELHGSSSFFKSIFKRGDTNANRQKLIELLTELHDSVPVTIDETFVYNGPDIRPPSEIILPQIPEKKSGLPAIIQVKEQRLASFAEIQSLHPLLDGTPEGEDLRKIATHIVKAGKANTELWARYNHLTENPDEAMPDAPPPPAPVMIDLNILEEREAARKSLNKAQNRIKGKAKPHPNTLQLIAERTQQIKDLDDKIARIRKEQSK